MSDFYIEDRECNSDESQECERSFELVCETRQKKLKPNRAMLRCGNSGALVLPVNTTAGARFTLTTVSVNVKDFKKPCIKLEFTSDIATTAAFLILDFQVFKQCKDIATPIPIGPIWTFSRSLAITDSDIFSFFVCDCDICDDECCTYSVVTRVASTVTVGVTSINHASLSAFIVDNDCNACK
ncbi:DUF4489 domain-containing protein [Lacrimispora sp.]|uniref:DUF4489 domain-containing protein n=1 Tax=Lacrimispora sp. TaxID=2719234 RepID=UPI00289FCFC3|nr:DUF4489 domain-containing protein [Lacrimispora sp.]